MFLTGNSIALIVISALTAGSFAHVSFDGAASCVGNSSLPCLSNKLVAVVRKIHNIREIPITEWMSLVPSGGDDRARSIDVDETTARSPQRRDGLIRILGSALDDFIGSRSLRITLPSWATPADHAIDLNVGRAFSEVTGRKKDKGMKGMGMVAMMMMGKMMMMSMGMVKMKAMKALMVSMIALVLSKVQLFKMLMDKKDEGGEPKHVVIVTSDHGGGGGGGGHSSGGGGGGHGGGGGGGGGGHGGGSTHVVESYGPPSSGGGWAGGGGGGGGGWSSGGGGSDHGSGSTGGGGDSWGGGGGSSWSSGGSGGAGGGYSYGPPAGGGWGKRAYHYDTYVTHSPPNTTTE